MKHIWLALLISISFGLFSPTAHASNSGDAQIERFEVWIRELRKILTISPDTRVVAEALVSGDARNITFHLQGLGRIYEARDKRFKSLILSDVKDLEDAIGQYDMWKSLDPARATQAQQVIVNMLEKEGWVKHGSSPHLDAIEKFIRNYGWDDYQTDRTLSLNVLRNQLQTLAATNYDLTRLEKRDGDGNGLHELRRELRWFLIEIRALNGLVQYDPNPVCSAPEYTPLLDTNLVNHKYATLSKGALEADPCLIERCLVLGLVRSVNVLGGIKDAGEENPVSRAADQVPPELVGQANVLYSEIQASRVFSRLSDNIGRCQH